MKALRKLQERVIRRMRRTNSWCEFFAHELTKSKRYSSSLLPLRRLAAASPADLTVLQWFARAATLAGKADMAADAWTAAKRAGSASMADEFDARIQAARSGAPLTVAIIGNCQVYPIARYLRRITEASVVTVTPRDFVDPRLTSLVVDEVARCQFIVSQPLEGGSWGALETKLLRKRRPDLIMMPSILFTGWQPDLFHLPPERWPGPKHTFIEFHSRLTLAAFLRNVHQDRVIELFNAYVFGKLGYFEEYDLAKRFLLDEARTMDFALDEEMKSWERGGIFIHTPNHPNAEVLWSFARKLAAKMKLEIDETVSRDGEYFRVNVWPLYPDLAKRRGLPGSLMFQPPKQQAVHLRDLIAKDYTAYAQTDLSKVDLSQPLAAARVLQDIGVGS